ncbi:GNAT family N-acetyltransferase [Prochlorococcus sp. MIT 0916]|uniref:GNAT family N-acetyltransferase n=1 Tax=Prochlorococcus sp. MIT 0916 TaxID=3082521 RepID=UPI0039B5F24F
MNKNIDIDILPVREKHLTEIIDILQCISKYKPSNNSFFEIWENFSSQPNYFGLVAIHKGKVVGFGSIFYLVKIRGGKMGLIEELATHKDYQNQGIASLLLKNLCNCAIKEQCYKVTLTCKENNISFYENRTFSLEGFYLNKLL